MKCEHCGEREAEVQRVNVVRSAEGEDARTENLCRVCASFDPNAMRSALSDILERAKDLPAEDRGNLQALEDTLKRWSAREGGDGSEAQG